ncbi:MULTISPECIES: hypothetical protein [Pseudomonas]|uniref:hypothetical protein n=1 Tax=Pseudomonas TaxID=286 RepID=UPI001186B22A|nr:MULTISPECIES: hypothetical protein [Pseudomonas]QUN68448.1 hypothetical protein KDB76_03640 [Pseudomonas sp. JS425]
MGMSLSKCLALAGLCGSLVILGACSNSVPSCSDVRTTDLVIDITKGELTKQLGAALVRSINFSVANIRTTDENEKTGAFKCAAELKMTGPAKESVAPVWYTVEATDDGNFYVNVAEEPI